MQTLKRFQQLITKVFGMTLKPGNDLKHYFWPEFNYSSKRRQTNKE